MDQENRYLIVHQVNKQESVFGLYKNCGTFLGPLYDTADDDDYDKNRRISLTQAYRRPNDMRQPMGARRIGINNGNHPTYKVGCFVILNYNYLIRNIFVLG